MIKLIRKILVVVLVIYVALFGLTKAIRYPEPIAAIKLGLAPASKTPDLMPAHTIKASTTPAAWKSGSEEMPANVSFNGTTITFDQFIAATHTNAFLVIRDGAITFEKYYNGMGAATRLPSYSVAKTMTSLMIGKLIDAGKLKESDTFVSILPEFKAGTSFDKVTIKDLLDMKGGVGVSDNYPTGPSGWGVAIAQMYASTDVDWFLMHNRKMKEDPGTFAEYRSVDTQMLGMIIKKVTGQSLVKISGKLPVLRKMRLGTLIALEELKRLSVALTPPHVTMHVSVTNSSIQHQRLLALPGHLAYLLQQ